MEPAGINNFQNSSHIRAEMSLLKNAIRMLYECSQNAPGMAAKYCSSVQEFKQNAVRILRMYFEYT